MEYASCPGLSQRRKATTPGKGKREHQCHVTGASALWSVKLLVTFNGDPSKAIWILDEMIYLRASGEHFGAKAGKLHKRAQPLRCPSCYQSVRNLSLNVQ